MSLNTMPCMALAPKASVGRTPFHDGTGAGARQRNGPTGVVKLAFIREFTRFENLAAGAA